MSLHDFWCPTCGQVLVDIHVPVAIGATAGAPLHCDRPTSWIPQVGRMDAANGPGFQGFDAYDGSNRPVHVDSLRKLRQVEEESQKMAADGVGQPILWRRYSQNHSNRDVHTLAPGWTGGAQPDPAFVKKHAAAIRRTAEEPDVAYGPGIDDSTPSALSHLKG